MERSASTSGVGPEPKQQAWRLFVAVELPEGLRRALREPLDQLGRIEEIRPSHLEQIHLTLHFLGNVEVARIAAIKEVLAPAIRNHAAFELTASGVDAFGHTRRPQVVWVGFARDSLDKIRGLQADTAHALASLGFETERDFTPHLTLGRVRRPLRSGARQALQRWFTTWIPREFGVLPVESVALMRSQLGGGPARHSVLEIFGLQ